MSKKRNQKLRKSKKKKDNQNKKVQKRQNQFKYIFNWKIILEILISILIILTLFFTYQSKLNSKNENFIPKNNLLEINNDLQTEKNKNLNQLETEAVNIKNLEIQPNKKTPSQNKVLNILRNDSNQSKLSLETWEKIQEIFGENFEIKVIQEKSSEGQNLIQENKIQKIPYVFSNTEIPETFLQKTETFFYQDQNFWAIDLDKIGQNRYFRLKNTTTLPTSVALSGKKGSQNSLKIFINFNNEYERKITNNILPILKQYIEDGSLKVFLINNTNSENNQTNLASKCIQKYGDRFFFDFLKIIYQEKKLPPSYKDLIDVARQIELSQYFLGKCIGNKTYENKLENEKKYSETNQVFKTPTFIINNYELNGNIDTKELLNLIKNIIEKNIISDEEINQILKINQELNYKQNEPFQGNPNSKVKINFYGNFSQPQSRNIARILYEINQKYPEKTVIYFRNFPETENDFLVAEAMECSHYFEKFWEYYNWNFVYGKTLIKDELIQNAQKVGINSRKFRQCLNENIFKQEVLYDLTEAKNLNFKKAPGICVNSTCLNDNFNYQKILEIIETEIKKNEIIQTN